MTRSSHVGRAITADATLCWMYMHHRQDPVPNYSFSHSVRYQSTNHVMRVKAIKSLIFMLAQVRMKHQLQLNVTPPDHLRHWYT